MKIRTLTVEFIILMVIGVVTLVESLRLIIYKDPQTLYDLLGPGYYLLGLGVCIMVTAVVYLAVNVKQRVQVAAETVDREMKFRLYGAFAGLAIYLVLIDLLGYLVSTFIFLILEFWVVGIRYWLSNLILSAIIAVAYYFVFVTYCSMVFPRGILF